ncbi:putative oxidase [Streptococcus anginosus]|uniref:Pyruvate oxidase n=2 Tax=Streptococcus anginosus TaxID=1328 RepID=A0AAP6BP67_STRAP|nr:MULTISPECIES: pyruvate oxidase [Streptococcus]AGU82286.1 putative oxidase [Streptococcus anginosus C1051]MCW1035232.1 pyruvate oxidase [Streptococcus anginosus]MDU6601264.1 pyruvate oxidase [Streptococcus anginosus]MDX5040465.1 pyruvate oxidase [Streptococcus anginosus]OFR40313.1 pyruvate oxidase [Streptococcus sp. HMSC071H03]
MTQGKITASAAMLNVLKTWGVDTIYGIPSGTLSSLMDALAEDKDIRFLQVRHEETGALAAVMQAKFGGSIGVAVGSGGPGATHLINGVYDAAMDNTPFLAILGSRPVNELNMDAFQELNQNPMYNGIAVYNKRVAYAEQLPKVIDEACRAAVSKKGPAVVEIPVNFGFQEIDENSYYGSGSYERSFIAPALNEVEINKAVEILNKAERPVIYAGFGGVKAGEVITELSRKIKAPIITTGKNFEAFEWNYEGLTGSAYRVGWKPANEVVFEADTVLFLGSNFPFAEVYEAFKNTEKFIQVDIDPYKLGKRHALDASILGDAGQAAKAILDKVNPVESTPWWRANVKNNQNWRDYMNKLEGKTEGELQLYQVYNAINKYADQDAIYSIDVGNSTQTSTRHLHMTPKNMWRTSPLFATMGIALPGGIAAKKDNPDRQVWNIMGDGAFNMCYPDVITNVQYNLPVINVVFTNDEYAFIKNKYEDTNKHLFGVDFPNADYAKIAEAQGAVGFTVDRIEDIDAVVAEAVKLNKEGKTVVIDARITQHRPLPVEVLELDPKLHSEEAIKAFKEKYEAEELVPFRLFLEEEGLQSRAIK